jgi:hypothetical protein
MKKFINVIIALLIICSCEPLIKLRVNGREYISTEFECGKATFTAYLIPEYIFINIRFSLNTQITINRNNCIVRKNGAVQNLVFYDIKDREIADSIFHLKDEDEISIYFSPENWFKEGDTITADTENFIICNGKPLCFPQLKINIEDLVGK